MRRLDAETIAAGTPGEVLMERAGQGTFQEILEFCARLPLIHYQRFLILTGKGNNGGDGHVIARYLAEDAFEVTVLSVCEKELLQGDALLNAERLPEAVNFVAAPDRFAEYLQPGTIVVDALLGTGISGPVKDPYAAMINAVNASGLPVVAVDIPSGLNADTGEAGQATIVADLTVTMALPKTGLILGDAAEHTGALRCVDIGILPELVASAEASFEAVLKQDVRPYLSRLPHTAHKGDLGRVLLVGASRRYPGALMLAGLGCLRCGGGLVTAAFPEAARAQLGPRPNALIQAPIPDGGKGFHNAAGQDALVELAEDQDVLALGPGLGREPESLDLIQKLLKTPKPAVLDADGLSVFERHPDVLPRAAPTVITPHPGEMQRVCQAVGAAELRQQDRLTQAKELAQRLQAYVVLKGAFSVIAGPDGRVAVNTSGTPALATGGSGDVLTGMVAAFLCQLEDPFAAIETAGFIHGYAAELRPDAARSLVADDLPELIGEAMQQISPLA